MAMSNKSKFLSILSGSIYLVLSLIFLLAFITHSENDNSFFVYNSGVSESQNILGILGSYLSDVLLKTFGIVVYFLPLTFFFWSIRILLLDTKITWLNFFFFWT